MLIWICALHCEAKPVIDFYRLRKSSDASGFDVYENDDMSCIVSGVGKIASASATAWAAARKGADGSTGWINLGIAGAADAPLGKPCLLHQVIDDDTGRRYFPVPPSASGLAETSCITIPLQRAHYHPHYLYDMEASGFLQAALRFSSAELVQSIKIVSDNTASPQAPSKPRVSELIASSMDSIDQAGQQLQSLIAEHSRQRIDTDFWNRLLSLGHFSQTQQNRLKPVCRYLLLRGHDPGELLRNLESRDNGGAIIETLETLAHQDSGSL